MNTKATFSTSIVIVMMLALVSTGQNANPSKPNPKTTPKDAAGNPAKLPPTASSSLVPKLVFKGSENMVTKNGKQVTSVVLSITNGSDFPAELFAVTPGLPPDPCGPGWDYPQEKHQQRLLLTVYARDRKQIYACAPYPSVKSLAFVRFYLEPGKPMPSGFQVVLKDRKKGTTYESNVVLPIAASTGTNK